MNLHAKPFDPIKEENNKLTINVGLTPALKEKIEIISKCDHTNRKKTASSRDWKAFADKGVQVESQKYQQISSPSNHNLEKLLEKVNSD